MLIPKTLPFVSNDTIKTFRHAVSLDEHRKRFDVTLWNPHEEVHGGLNCLKDASVAEVWFSGTHSGMSILFNTLRMPFSSRDNF
jgi:hypothetical protein